MPASPQAAVPGGGAAGGVDAVDPRDYAGWDEAVVGWGATSPFAGRGWAAALCDTYRYDPCYLLLTRDARVAGLLPMMEVRSRLTGVRGVSLPFTDGCRPIAGDPAAWQALWQAALRLADERRWRSVEVRSVDLPPPGAGVAAASFVEHRLDLGRTAETVWGRLRGSYRTAIRKAQASGVEVGAYTSQEAMRRFYRLHCRTRRRHGLPPPPWRFFERLEKSVLASGGGCILLATHRGIDVATAVFLWLGEDGVFKYGASDLRYQELRANNLVMWEGVQECLRRNLKTLSLGRTEPGNRGLRQFKEGWCGSERPIHYYRYDVGPARFAGPAREAEGRLSRVVARLPLPVLRVAGALLYRHMG